MQQAKALTQLRIHYINCYGWIPVIMSSIFDYHPKGDLNDEIVVSRFVDCFVYEDGNYL